MWNLSVIMTDMDCEAVPRRRHKSSGSSAAEWLSAQLKDYKI